MEGHATKCVDRHCELAKEKTEQVDKVSNPCLDDHHIKHEEFESEEELRLSKKCFSLARLGDLTSLVCEQKLQEQSQNGQELVTDA